MINININELRRLAQAATPGPWKLLPVGDKSKFFAVADNNLLSVLTVVDECGTSFGAVYLDGDAKFIAAANPSAISELLDRLEEAENAWKISDKTVYDLTEKVIPNIQEKLEAAEKERDDLLSLLKETRSTLEMWKDVAPAVSLCADIDAAIAKATGYQP